MPARIHLYFNKLKGDGKCWLAQLTGTGGQFGVEREFLIGRKVTSKSGTTGTKTFTVTQDGVYEAHDRDGRSWHRVIGETVTSISQKEALDLLAAPVAVPEQAPVPNVVRVEKPPAELIQAVHAAVLASDKVDGKLRTHDVLAALWLVAQPVSMAEGRLVIVVNLLPAAGA